MITKEAYDGDIVSRLRNWRGLHLAHGGDLFEEAAGVIERLRLSAAERRAVEFFSKIDGPHNVPVASKHAAVLREMLERIDGDA